MLHPSGRRRHPVPLCLIAAIAPCLLWSCGSDSDSNATDPEKQLSEVNGSTDASTSKSEPSEFAALARRLRASANPYVGRGQLEELRRQRSFAVVSAPIQRIGWHVDLALESLRHGEIDEAEAAIVEAVRYVESDSTVADSDVPFLWRAKGIVHLRRAEVENCIARHNADCCLFPLAGGGVHTDDAPARAAFDSYLKALSHEPNDLSARWLLNLSAMALGQHPSLVPDAFVIPASAFDSLVQFPRWNDVAPAVGVDAFNLCGGAIVDDLDGDGRLDIATSTFDLDGPLLVFRNLGAEGFADTSADSGTSEQLGGLNCIAADYDNDGDTDILVLRGAWLFDDGRIRNSLLRNDGNARFTDVTVEAGLAEPAYPTQAAAWGDFDNDGDLDLYVGNEARPDDPSGGDFPSQLFRNNGNGTFTDIAASAGVTNDRYCKGVAAGDFDNDGALDLYVSNIGANRLYRNLGDGSFEDVAPTLGLTEPDRSFATWFFDDNNDGALDIFVAAYEAPIASVAADALGQTFPSRIPALYRNNGDGSFRDVAAEAGLAHAWLPMGAGFGDLNNDGYPDMYLATGDPNLESLMPNVMLLNDGNGSYDNVSTAGGFGHLQKGHGVVFADIDDDGDQDVYNQLGGFFPGDAYHNALFRNPGDTGAFVYLSLKGMTSNRAGYGTRIAIDVDTPVGPRTIHHATGCVSSFGSRPTRQEIGLGDATRITRLTIEWPASATTRTYTDLPVNQWYDISEDSDHSAIRALRPYQLGPR